MSKIRILHSVSNMDRAGIETMLMNYYRFMDRDLIQFDFLCNKKKIGMYDDEIHELGGRIYRTPGLNPIKYPLYLKYMKDLFNKEKYNVIEAHNGALGVYALYAAYRNRIPVRIFHAHGASITKDIKYPLKAFCLLFLPRYLNNRFSCGKEAARCYFGNKVADESKYVYIKNAIDTERFVYNSSVRNKIRNEYSLTDKFVIGHVGRFMKQKNHRFLIKVFQEVVKLNDRAVLVLAGEGELQEEIKKLVEEFDLLDKVVFLGNIANINEWYQAFDAFVLPSIWEGLPVVGIEAQAADLPCFFSDSITKEVAITNNVEFIGLEQSKSFWAKKICDSVIENDRHDMSQTIIEQGYDIKSEARKLQDLYINLAGESL